jgi:phage terminase large subunit-like protein
MIVKGLQEKSFFYDQKKADRVIDFAEKYCRHHEGALGGKVIKLEEWQKAFLSILFGIVDEEGNRQFREVLLVIGRKNGKTLLAAIIGAFCAYWDGEYGGRIYMAAPKLQQAGLCYDAFYQIVKTDPKLNERAKKRRTDIYIEKSNTSIAPLAFSEKRADGLNISLGILDEVAAWHGEAGKRFYEVLKSSAGARRQPILLSISTAGYENEGAFDELVKRGTRVLLGDSKETRLLPLIYQIDDEEKWNDINELRKSNPNLGVSVSVDYLLEEIRIAEGSLSKLAEFKTKYCNLKQNASSAWLSMKAVNGAMCEALDPNDFRDCYCVGGIDLSQTTDLTAACFVIERSGVEYVIAHAWLPGEKIEEATARDGIPYRELMQKGFVSASGENFIDYHDVYDWIVRMIREYQLYPLMIGYDRYSSQYLISDLKKAGIHLEDCWQGWNMTPAIQRLEGELKDGLLKIGNNDLMKIHLLDVALKKDTESRRVMITKLSPMSHIDLCACLLDALIVKDKWSAQIGEQLKN